MENNSNSSLSHRDKISSRFITWSFILIFLISLAFFISTYDQPKEFDKMFNVIIPLLATWIGTILAFYFGRENFEAASSHYRAIINQLTPDLLDDVEVNQIMIDKATMVWKEYSSIKTMDIQSLSKFLEEISKSRLPVLDKGKIKFVIHKSIFDEALAKHIGQTEPLSFTAFEGDPQYLTLMKSFESVPSNSKLEQVLEQLKSNEKIQDVFVEENSLVVGWLPNSLINRYLMKK